MPLITESISNITDVWIVIATGLFLFAFSKFISGLLKLGGLVIFLIGVYHLTTNFY